MRWEYCKLSVVTTMLQGAALPTVELVLIDKHGHVVLRKTPIDALNWLGEAGWELAGYNSLQHVLPDSVVTMTDHVLKRPLP